jgi:hypothetical protein
VAAVSAGRAIEEDGCGYLAVTVCGAGARGPAPVSGWRGSAVFAGG